MPDMIDLERRVIALEKAQTENAHTLKWISGQLGQIAAVQDQHSERLDRIENAVWEVKADIAGLRRDMPGIVRDVMRDFLREQKRPDEG